MTTDARERAGELPLPSRGPVNSERELLRAWRPGVGQ